MIGSESDVELKVGENGTDDRGKMVEGRVDMELAGCWKAKKAIADTAGGAERDSAYWLTTVRRQGGEGHAIPSADEGVRRGRISQQQVKPNRWSFWFDDRIKPEALGRSLLESDRSNTVTSENMNLDC